MTAPPRRFDRLRPLSAGALLAGGGALAAYLAAELHVFSGELGFPLDDGWIHLCFAQSLAAGNGLSLNPGSCVGGSTSPLWTALLAPGFLLPGGPVAWAKLLGAALYLATIDATARLGGALGLGAGARRLAAALVALTPWLVWSALSGMETLLFTALSLWGLKLHVRERGGAPVEVRSLPVLALAGLARPEGWLLVAAAVADRAVVLARVPATATDASRLTPRLGVPSRSWWHGAAAAAVVLAPCFAVYRFLGGSFLPTTFAVKSGFPTDLVPNGRHLARALEVTFDSQPIMTLAAGAGVLALIRRSGTDRDRGLLPVLWLLGLALAKALMTPEQGPSGVGNFGRYYFPLLPVVVVLGVVGADGVLRLLSRRARAAAVLILLAPQLWDLARGPLLFTQTLANVADSDVAAARWLAGRLPPEARIAAQDVGALGYFLPNEIVDLTGIVNPAIVPVLREGEPGDGRPNGPTWEDRLLAYLERERPDYLVVFPEHYPFVLSHPGFAPVRRFPVAHNVTMAGDELAILATPWTRAPARLDPALD